MESEYILKSKELFADHYQAFGCQELPSVLISSGIDPKVRFVGSPTSVFKPYLLGKPFEKNGLFLNQGCLKTKNLGILLNDSISLEQSSFFPCQGVLTPYSRLGELSHHMLDYFLNVLKIPNGDLEAWIHPDHTDLLKAFAHSPLSCFIKKNTTLSSLKYAHFYDIPGLTGRSFSLALRHAKMGRVSYVGAIVVVENKGIPQFLEITIYPALIMTKLFGFDHILDCFTIPRVNYGDPKIDRKIEDCTIVIDVLSKEGLQPSNKHNRGRLLKKYIQVLASLKNKTRN